MAISKRLKRSLAMLVTVLMMASAFTACGSNEDAKTDTTESSTTSVETESKTESDTESETASDTASETTSDTASETTSDIASKTADDTSTITEDEAIELVKQKVGEDFSFIPADELEEINGSQYYVIYVKKLLDTGTLTTLTTYLVKTDGSEVFERTYTYDSTTDDSSTITVDEAIELVKQEIDGDYSYIPYSELLEKDGSQYYVIYINKYLLETGNSTTLTKYLVKTDGSEVFDMYESENNSNSTTEETVSSYVGEYVCSGDVGEVTFIVSEDGSFEMITVGEVNNTVTGLYKFGVTNSESVIKLILYPHKSINESNGEVTEEDFSGVEGSAVIEGDTLTLSMESMDTVFTRK